MTSEQTPRQRQLRSTIVNICLPIAVHRFLMKNEDYKDDNDEFGAKGEVMQLSKKVKKIKRAIWDEEKLTGEPLDEVIDDMIGHLLLLREQLISKSVAGGTGCPPPFTAEEWNSAYNQGIGSMYGG